MLELTFKSALALHVLAGATALLSGLFAMSLGKKGSKPHNISGIIYYWAMAIVFITTVLFFILKPTQLRYQFFLGIGIVSFYPCWTGRRMLSMKKGVNPFNIDFFAMWLVGAAGLGMLAYGFYCNNKGGDFGQYGILFSIFGVVALANFYGDFKMFIKKTPTHKMFWFLSHGGKMMGSYGAALTAFCVNVVPKYLPDGTPTYIFIMTWTLPGVGMGLVSYFLLKKYRMQFKAKGLM